MFEQRIGCRSPFLALTIAAVACTGTSTQRAAAQPVLFIVNGSNATVGEYNALTGAAINPAFINGQGLSNPFLLSYMMPPDSEVMVHFVNYWLELRRADGLRAREASYWIQGRPRAVPAPRWSIVRDVLHWKE